MAWTLATAKENLEDVVLRAVRNDPQTIHLPGGDAVVIMSKVQFEELLAEGSPPTFKELLVSMNFDGVDLERDQRPARDIDL